MSSAASGPRPLPLDTAAGAPGAARGSGDATTHPEPDVAAATHPGPDATAAAAPEPPAGFARLDAAPFPRFAPGEVWLVGAGPGAPGLLTLLAYHALQAADIVVYDALVNPAILAFARAEAVREFAGKRGGKPSPGQADITLRLIAHARAGRRVLRLKGGDPFMFGRGGEECEGLQAAGIAFRIVPGISAGLGGLAYAGIPATHRAINQSVTFLTGHDVSGEMPAAIDWRHVAHASPVIVMYMATRHLPEIAAKLIEAGRDPVDPVAVVANATLPQQEIVETRLGAVATLAAERELPTPAVVVVGAVARLRDRLDWYVAALRENPIG
jgi:uroporphyrin-III C-methyltransferase